MNLDEIYRLQEESQSSLLNLLKGLPQKAMEYLSQVGNPQWNQQALENANSQIPQLPPRSAEIQPLLRNLLAMSSSPEVGNLALNFMPFTGQVGPVYHGSPYKFTKFANEKIGTGEGAQAMGYGHYGSEAKMVGEDYMKELADKSPEYKKVIQDLISKGEPQSYAESAAQGIATRNPKAMEYYKYITGKEPPSIGYLYEYTINKGKPSSEDVFLEWDKPVDKDLKNKIVSQMQSEDIRKFTPYDAYKDREGFIKDFLDKASGRDIYEYLSKSAKLGDKGTSDFFNKLGITGIKYPSGTLSGIKGSPYYNYVVFDPERISIDKINDIPLEDWLAAQGKK